MWRPCLDILVLSGDRHSVGIMYPIKPQQSTTGEHFGCVLLKLNVCLTSYENITLFHKKHSQNQRDFKHTLAKFVAQTNHPLE